MGKTKKKKFLSYTEIKCPRCKNQNCLTVTYREYIKYSIDEIDSMENIILTNTIENLQDSDYKPFCECALCGSEVDLKEVYEYSAKLLKNS